MQVEYVDIDKLIPFEKNPKKHPDDQIKRIVRSIQEFGFTNPIMALKENNMVIAGHARLKAARQMNLAQVPVIFLDMPYEKAIAYVVADNRLAELAQWDNQMLLPLLDEIKLADIDVELTGFDMNFLEKEKEIDLLSTEHEDIEGMSEVFGLKSEIDFPGVGMFDFPALKEEMILDIPAPASWAGPTATKTPPPYVYNYGTDSVVGLDFSQTVVSFYTDDRRFEALYTNNAEIAGRFLNKKIMGMVSPNFSTYFRMPKAMRIWNIFRSRWVSRYFQEAGIKVIPDISCGRGDIDFVFDGIPRHAPVCFQAHRKYNKEEEVEKRFIIEKTFEVLEPSRVWVYATEDRKNMFPALDDPCVEWIVPRHKVQEAYRKELDQKDKTMKKKKKGATT